nr:hypothetical protein [uncultured Granulicatella sp.]
MKKKLAIIGTIALLGIGGVTVFSLNNPDWRANTIFATAKDKQLAWLKEHEEEIVSWVKSHYPQVNTIQFDWDSLKIRDVSNGVANIGYNLSIRGTVNEIPETIILVDFLMNKRDDTPNMSQIGMNHSPRIKKDGILYKYE